MRLFLTAGTFVIIEPEMSTRTSRRAEALTARQDFIAAATARAGGLAASLGGRGFRPRAGLKAPLACPSGDRKPLLMRALRPPSICSSARKASAARARISSLAAPVITYG